MIPRTTGPAPHRHLQKQVAAARGNDATLDIQRLLDLVGATYEESDRDRRRTDRSIALMVEENDQLFADLKNTLEALERRNQHFVAALENLSHGLIICDDEDKLVVANRRLGEIYGISADQLVAGVPISRLMAAAVDRGTFENSGAPDHLLALRREAKGELTADHQCRLADGRIISFVVNRLNDGGWISLHRDVTQSLAAQARLAESEARFRDFAEAASDWCWETDSEHRFIDPESFLGRTPVFGAKEFVGNRRIDLPLVEEDREVLAAHMVDVAARKPFRDMLYRIPNPDGSIAWITASGKPVFDTLGAFVGYRGTARDASEEELRKLDLKKSMEAFRDFAEAASDWFWETDEKHRFRGFSEAFTSIARKNNLAHIGKTSLQFDLHAEDRPLLERHLDEVLERRLPFKDLLYRVRGLVVPWVWIRASGKPLYDTRGRFTGYRGSASDVTEEMGKRAELNRKSVALERAELIASLGHWRWDARAGATEWSPSLFEILGFSRDQDVPSLRSFLKRALPEDRAALLSAFASMAKGSAIAEHECRYRPVAGGETRHCRFRVDPEFDTKGQLTGAFGIVQDITELKRAERLLKQRGEQLVEAQRLGKIGDWSYRFDSGAMRWSSGLHELMGHDPLRFEPSPEAVAAQYVGDGHRRVRASQAEVLRTGLVRAVDVKMRRADGSIGDFVVTTRAEQNTSGQVSGLYGTVQDITDRKQAEEQLEKLAYFDPLTGLANRALFKREIDDVIQRACRSGGCGAALLLLDLDRFKEVNDTLGHAAGDELLGKVARLITRAVGHGPFIARLGGDEFAVIISDCADGADAARLAGRVIEAVGAPIQLERGEVVISTSIGIVMLPTDGRDSETLLRHADLALYRAKADGRGRRAFFESNMNTIVQAKITLARDLRQAIGSVGGLETRYQPQVALADRTVVGFETLIRWKHPTKGYIAPSDFIPIAESSSLICDIGLWILRRGAEQAKAWLDAGERRRQVSVNISAAQIWQTDIEADVGRVLDEVGLPPELLCLELTESLFADHSEYRVRKALRGLKRLGVTLALDDFGTGFSSLSYLTQLPFDKLKIDRLFIHGIAGSPRKCRLLEGVVALGRGLGMIVVGEGAETAEELEILRAAGCDHVQGFVFARPERAHDALAFARAIEGESPAVVERAGPTGDDTAADRRAPPERRRGAG